MIEWLNTMSEQLSLQPRTLYQAVSILDHFCSLQDGSEDVVKVLAVTCLLIAAKAYEIDDDIPDSVSLLKLIVDPGTPIEVVNECSSPAITRCERLILNTLTWNLDAIPSFFEIVEIF